MSTNPLKRHNYPGKIIAVEGMDGSGKSTQLALLRQWLEGRGHTVGFTEWNSSELVRDTTRRAKRKQLLTPITFSLLHAADFADRFDQHVVPLLKAGAIICADRWVYTAFARDGVRGLDPAWLSDLYSFAFQPDLVFYFSVPLATALSRVLSGRQRLNYYEAGMDQGLDLNIEKSFRKFQKRILNRYRAMAGTFDFQVIDATQSIEVQQREVRSIVSRRLGIEAMEEEVPRAQTAA